MVVSWPLVVLAAALVVSMVLLAVVCLHCRTNGPLVSIRQASEEYMPSTEFRVIHPSQPTTDHSFRSPSNQLTPFSPLPDLGNQGRHHSFNSQRETESNPSYENPVDGPDYVNGESEGEDPDTGYITVLPEGEARPTPIPSRPSTPSSEGLHDYENLQDTVPSGEYLNVDPQDQSFLSCFPSESLKNPRDLSRRSSSSNSSSDEDDEDEEANYVNVGEGPQTA